MKLFYFNDNNKLYKRIRWSKDLTYFIIMTIILFLFFYFLLSRKEELLRPIYTSISISFLITLGIEIGYLIENKEYIYVLKDEKLYVIMFQNESYYLEEEFLSSEKLRKDMTEEKISDILANTDKYIGISILEVEKLGDLKERKNHYSFISSGNLSFWKAEGNFFTINNFVMDFRKKRKRLVVTKEYKDYDELLNYVKKKLNS